MYVREFGVALSAQRFYFYINSHTGNWMSSARLYKRGCLLGVINGSQELTFNPRPCLIGSLSTLGWRGGELGGFLFVSGTSLDPCGVVLSWGLNGGIFLRPQPPPIAQTLVILFRFCVQVSSYFPLLRDVESAIYLQSVAEWHSFEQDTLPFLAKRLGDGAEGGRSPLLEARQLTFTQVS